MGQNYSFKAYNKENMARAIGISMSISVKHSIEICNFIRNKNVGKAKNVLNDVIEEKQFIPFRRFNSDVGHKKGGRGGAGRYPKKASKEILDLINQVEANAQIKGLNTANLVITHLIANKATTVTRFGRKRSRKAKRTNIEIVVQEKTAEKKATVKEITEKVEKKETKEEIKLKDKKETEPELNKEEIKKIPDQKVHQKQKSVEKESKKDEKTVEETKTKND